MEIDVRYILYMAMATEGSGKIQKVLLFISPDQRQHFETTV